MVSVRKPYREMAYTETKFMLDRGRTLAMFDNPLVAERILCVRFGPASAVSTACLGLLGSEATSSILQLSESAILAVSVNRLLNPRG